MIYRGDLGRTLMSKSVTRSSKVVRGKMSSLEKRVREFNWERHVIG
jgi:hypothetical protein